MRIRELLEGTNFNDDKFVTPAENGRELNFDLVEDLVHFMNHDDNVYRRVVYPKIAICLDSIESKKKISPKIFKSAVEESYRQYIKKFPIRELPNDIDESVCKKVCDKIHDDFKQHVSDGLYKD